MPEFHLEWPRSNHPSGFAHQSYLSGSVAKHAGRPRMRCHITILDLSRLYLAVSGGDDSDASGASRIERFRWVGFNPLMRRKPFGASP